MRRPLANPDLDVTVFVIWIKTKQLA